METQPEVSSIDNDEVKTSKTSNITDKNQTEEMSAKKMKFCESSYKSQSEPSHQKNVQVMKKLANLEIHNILKIQEKEIKDRLQHLTIYNHLSDIHSCVFLWKIRNYEEQKRKLKHPQFRKSVKIYSDPFVTNPFGYKFRLALRPRINNLMLKYYLDCYLKLMVGPMDEILPWPLKYHAKITIIDQLYGRLNRGCEWEKTVSCASEHDNYHSFSYRDAGKNNFISIDDFSPLFLVNNSLLFKVEVKVFK